MKWGVLLDYDAWTGSTVGEGIKIWHENVIVNRFKDLPLILSFNLPFGLKGMPVFLKTKSFPQFSLQLKEIEF